MEAGRGRQICEAISQSLTWQWMGHAVIAPGYKPDSGSLANVHCRLKIGKDDLDALQRLTQSHDWRLQVGAEMLLRMATDGDGKTGEPENSMSDPASAGSGLGKGCGR